MSLIYLPLSFLHRQGCTKACVDAVSLDGLLRNFSGGKSLPSNFGRDFFACQAKRTGGLWYVSCVLWWIADEAVPQHVRESFKSVDYAWQSTMPMKGETLAHGAQFRAFRKKLIELARKVIPIKYPVLFIVLRLLHEHSRMKPVAEYSGMLIVGWNLQRSWYHPRFCSNYYGILRRLRSDCKRDILTIQLSYNYLESWRERIAW